MYPICTGTATLVLMLRACAGQGAGGGGTGSRLSGSVRFVCHTTQQLHKYQLKDSLLCPSTYAPRPQRLTKEGVSRARRDRWPRPALVPAGDILMACMLKTSLRQAQACLQVLEEKPFYQSADF